MRHDPRSLFDPRRFAVNARPDDNGVSGLLLNDTSIYHQLSTLNRRQLVLKLRVLKLRALCIEGPSGISWVLSKPRQIVDVVIPDIWPTQSLRPAG